MRPDSDQRRGVYELLAIFMSLVQARNSLNTERTDLVNIFARDILHVHCARRGRASTIRVCTGIVLVTGNMPTNFQKDWTKNKVTMIARV